MAYNDCSGDQVGIWRNEARTCVNEIRRLADDKDELIFTIMKGNCYDHLEQLIDVADRMKHLLLNAEETFSPKTVDEPREFKEKNDERIDDIHEIILDVKSSVE